MVNFFWNFCNDRLWPAPIHERRGKKAWACSPRPSRPSQRSSSRAANSSKKPNCAGAAWAEMIESVEEVADAAAKHLPRPSADGQTLVAAALAGLKTIHKPGFNYAKAGVSLSDPAAVNPQSSANHFDDQSNDLLGRFSAAQGDLDLGEGDEPDLKAQDGEKATLMAAMDQINRRHGRGTVKLASAGFVKESRGKPRESAFPHHTEHPLHPERPEASDVRRWAMKQSHRTSRYTTQWSEMPTVKA